MPYVAERDMVTTLVDFATALTGWGGIEFLVFIILILIMITMYKFVAGR